MVKPPDGIDNLLPFERLLTEISTLFTNLPADKIDSEIVFAQRRIWELLHVDRSTAISKMTELPAGALLDREVSAATVPL